MAVIYKPGREPERIKARLKTLFSKLDEEYPDKVIVGLQAYHKNWDETARELYQLLGYESKEAFFSAYGYSLERQKGGRPKAFDPHEIVREFQRRYPNGSGFLKLDDLFEANPDLATKKKTMMNTANEVFGMPLAKYLKTVGVLKKIDETLDEKLEELKRRYSDGRALPRTLDQLKEDNADIPSISTLGNLITKKYPGVSVVDFLQQQGLMRVASDLCTLQLPGLKRPFYALSASKSIREGDYVECKIGLAELSVIGKIINIKEYSEGLISIPESNLPIVKTTVGVTKYNNELLRGVICVNAVGTVGDLLNSPSVKLEELEKRAVNNRIIEGKKVTVACCRGLTTDIVKAVDYLISKDNQTYAYSDIVLIDKGIAETTVFGADAIEIMQQYPNLKIVMFIENQNEKKVSVGYSRSGTAGITDFYIVGSYNPSDSKRWSRKHSPSEKKFALSDSSKNEYEFKYYDEWVDMSYAIDINGKKMVMGGNN